MQRLAISGLLSVMLIVLLTGTFITRRDLASVVDRGIAPEERNEQLNTAWVQDSIILDPPDNQQQQAQPLKPAVVVNPRLRHTPPADPVVEEPIGIESSGPGAYVVKQPNPPLDDVTHQRREKVKEV